MPGELATRKPTTVPVRLPEDVVADARRWAAFAGCTPGEMLTRAWRWYINAHRQDIAAEYEEAARRLREGPARGET